MRAVKWLAPLVVLAVVIGIWQLYCDIAHVPAISLPSPSEVASALWQHRSALWDGLRVTGGEILLGLLVGTVLTCLITPLIHFSHLARLALYPLLVGSQAIPVFLLAPVLVLWLGFGILPKMIVVGIVCFFPIVITTLAALDSVDLGMLKLLKTFDAGRWQVFRLVELPQALPGVLTGLKLAAVLAVIGAILAEQSGSSSGLGELLTITSQSLETAEAFAIVVVLCVFAIALFAVLTVLQTLLLPWANRPKPRQTK
jgi:putative hydroxymethylpyrimidine transport system permease protein